MREESLKGKQENGRRQAAGFREASRANDRPFAREAFCLPKPGTASRRFFRLRLLRRARAAGYGGREKGERVRRVTKEKQGFPAGFQRFDGLNRRPIFGILMADKKITSAVRR